MAPASVAGDAGATDVPGAATGVTNSADAAPATGAASEPGPAAVTGNTGEASAADVATTTPAATASATGATDVAATTAVAAAPSATPAADATDNTTPAAGATGATHTAGSTTAAATATTTATDVASNTVPAAVPDATGATEATASTPATATTAAADVASSTAAVTSEPATATASTTAAAAVPDTTGTTEATANTPATSTTTATDLASSTAAATASAASATDVASNTAAAAVADATGATSETGAAAVTGNTSETGATDVAATTAAAGATGATDTAGTTAAGATADTGTTGASGASGNEKLDETIRLAAGTPGTSRAIVRFNSEQDAEEILARLGIPHVRELRTTHVVDLPNSLIRALAAEQAVAGVSADRIASGAMHRVTGTIESNYVNATMKYTGRNVGVAIIDSGLGLHDDLDKKSKSMSAWVDFLNGRTVQYDDFGHGTNIGGIISGDGYDSNRRHSGVAPDSRIVALMALNGKGEGYVSDIIAALEWTVDHRRQYNIRVVNISASAPVLESSHTDPLCLAVQSAVEAGITVVASAGNLGKNPSTGNKIWGGIGAPGNCPWALTVGASSDEGDRDRSNDTIASFSSRGPTRFDIASKPDIAAPGTGIVAPITWKSRMYTTSQGLLYDGPVKTTATLLAKPYMAMSGTSMSAAVVSGIVALMVQANPALTPNLIKAILQYTAEFNPNYHVLEEGAGFVNACDAVELSEFFRRSAPGAAYPSKTTWSHQIIWGNLRVSGGILTPNASAWKRNQQWGASQTVTGSNIVWGDNCSNWICTGAERSHGGIWGSYADDNIVWGNQADDNIVWGNYADDNIVWGNNGDNIVWGNASGDFYQWGF